jgi:hypothetical protein
MAEVKNIKNVTLKIKEAEMIEAQLPADDLEVLQPAPVRCDGTYCESGYSDLVSSSKQ